MRAEVVSVHPDLPALAVRSPRVAGAPPRAGGELLLISVAPAAVGKLVESVGASVGAYAFVVELSFLNGREKLGGREIRSLITY